MTLQHRDRITVEKDGEQIEVYNWVNVEQPHVVWGAGHAEAFDAKIGAGDSPVTPEYVTKWVADELWMLLDIDLSKYDEIEVVDVESDEVAVF